jgi:hypothetical protein
MKNKRYEEPEQDGIDEVSMPEPESDVTYVEQQVVADVAPVVDDACLLKVDHTHAGVKYVAGTPVAELNAGAKALEFLKEVGVI